MTLQQLQIPVQAEYDRFVQEYQARTFDQTPILDEVGAFLDGHPGKRLRPLMLLLAAKACGTMSDGHILLATAVEMLHNASLMHDDVVDESDTRRGQASVRGRWGNQAAVLCGDYYFAQTMQLLQQVGNPQASALVAKTVTDMSRGELLQLSVTRGDHASLDEYLQVIQNKTASLISTCCRLGASSLTDSPAPYVDTLGDFGLHYGIAFQLHDDLGSLNPVHDVALPQGIDARDLLGRHTRLASQALDSLPPSEARETLRSLLLPSAPQPE